MVRFVVSHEQDSTQKNWNIWLARNAMRKTRTCWPNAFSLNRRSCVKKINNNVKMSYKQSAFSHVRFSEDFSNLKTGMSNLYTFTTLYDDICKQSQKTATWSSIRRYRGHILVLLVSQPRSVRRFVPLSCRRLFVLSRWAGVFALG